MIENRTIENGYFKIGLWTTYRCNVGCPHCYLKGKYNKETDLSLNDYKFLLNSIKEYKNEWKDFSIDIYGGEPMSMKPDYYNELFDITLSYFNNCKFHIYTSLQKINDEWIKLFKRFEQITCSFDYEMRSLKYNNNLFSNIKLLRNNNIEVSIISVFNKTFFNISPIDYYNIIKTYDINYFGIIPFLKIKDNEKSFKEWAVPLEHYSQYLIDLHKILLEKNELDKSGTLYHIKSGDIPVNNIGAYTFFIDGGLNCLYMDYNNGVEYLQNFGKISKDISFKNVIEGDKRIEFLKNQRNFNNNIECLICDYSNKCFAEVFKDKYDNSNECIGGKMFLKWLDENGII